MHNSKELFRDALNLEARDRVPCALHWWGIYKYETLGLDYTRDAWQDAEKLVKVYSDFYEKFRPDWFHLHIGTPTYFRDAEVVERAGKTWLAIDPRYRNIKATDRYFSVNSGEDEEIVDFADYLLGSRSFKPKIDLGTRRSIDDFIELYIHMSMDEIIELGYTDHVKEIGKRYGEDVFINVHIPSAVCEIFDPVTGYTGFEEGLMAFHDYPDGMGYLFERCYEEQLEWAKAYAQAGAHAYTISESYISPDIANPAIYRNYLKDIHVDYFSAVEDLGMLPICNFWGDVNPILDDLAELPIRGLMVEESKKTFMLDVRKISERLDGRMCVFGNLDSITLLHTGTAADVREETLRQLEGCGGNFIMANGSPVTPGTPEDNIRTFVETTKDYRRSPGS